MGFLKGSLKGGSLKGVYRVLDLGHRGQGCLEHLFSDPADWQTSYVTSRKTSYGSGSRGSMLWGLGLRLWGLGFGA